jgi:predicted aspartyl protease
MCRQGFSSLRWVGAVGVGLVLQAFTPGEVRLTGASRIPGATSRTERVRAGADAASRMTVMVRVDGRGPYPFVVDTGADRTVISSELAGKLGLKPGEPVMLHGTAGADLTPTARIDDLDIGARQVRDVLAPTLGGAALGADGMLGIDSLSDQRMVMDFRHGDMSIGPSRGWDFGADVIVVRAKSRYGQLILVDAAMNGRPLKVIIDSGAQNTIGNLALERMVENMHASPINAPAEVISVSGRSTPARFAVLPRVRIGEARLSNVPIAFADLHTFAQFGMNDGPAMLLGMDVLRQFDRVTVDFRRRQVSFQLPSAN